MAPMGNKASQPAVWRLLRTTIPKRLWKNEPECPSCGYLLVGLGAAGTCPECGDSYTEDSAHLSASRTRALLLRVGIYYVLAVMVVPAFVRVFLPREAAPLMALAALVFLPIVSARLVGALVALAVEHKIERSILLGLMLLLVAYMVLLIASVAMTAAVYQLSPRFLL